MGQVDPLMPKRAPNLWEATAPAILPEDSANTASPQPARAWARHGGGPLRSDGMAALQQAADAAAEELGVDSMVDASLLLGRSFRAGWGPHCTFVQPCEPLRQRLYPLLSCASAYLRISIAYCASSGSL